MRWRDQMDIRPFLLPSLSGIIIFWPGISCTNLQAYFLLSFQWIWFFLPTLLLAK